MPRAAAARTAVTALPSEVTGTIADSAATTMAGQYADPRVTGAIAALAEAGQRHGKLVMVGGIPDPAMLDDLAPLGYAP